jgi:hypothetical protein
MLAATAAAIALVVLEVASRGFGALGLQHVALVIGALFGGAVVGKAIGLAWAERRWRETVRAAISAYRAVGAA